METETSQAARTSHPVPALAALLPPGGGLTSDALLDRFVGWVAATGLELYPAQEEAILELYSAKHVILNTPTGSGKSLVATALHYKALAEGKRSFYTCPIKALVNEKFFALCTLFGADNVGMLTGDAALNREAPIICCTAEILANLALRDSASRIEYVVMDEFHYYADKERGIAWQVPLISLPETSFLLMSATLGDVTAIADAIRDYSNREVAVVRSADRPVPLDFEYAETPLHETLEKLLEYKKVPVYLVNFTQRAAAEQAQNLMSINFCSKEEKEQLRVALTDFAFDTPYGKDFQRFLRHGIGIHHAGLLPKYRLLVERLAQAGLLKVVSGTDTLGVGVNIPLRTVLFTQLCKFDGEKVGILSVREFHQIAGRAGRKGFDEQGSVVVQAPEHVVENLRLAEKAKAGKKVVKKQPPTKGFVHWDRSTFERLLKREPEPLESRFQVTHGLLLNMLQDPTPHRGGGYGRLLGLITRSHGNDFNKRAHKKSAAVGFRTLRHAGLVRVTPYEVDGYRHGSRAEVSADLGRDFSLHQTLGLYLLETLGRLDLASPSFALDLLSLVESILENPQVVLFAQLDRLKTERLAEMKAEGIEYDQRIEELDKMEWPKPLRDFIYLTFNDFAARHPWVAEESIRPKSVAREMLERFCSFDDYVRDYGLQRSEGVLLRYLSEVYKTLVQSVPESYRDERVEDLIAELRLLLRAVDSSLLDEWERLRHPELNLSMQTANAPPAAARAPRLDKRAFASRVRAELHRLLRALAARDYAAALVALAPDESGAVAWTIESVAEAMAPYWAEHAGIDVTPAARTPDHTILREVSPDRWTAQQRIVDPAADEDWMIDCRITRREGVELSTTGKEADAPLIELVAIRR